MRIGDLVKMAPDVIIYSEGVNQDTIGIVIKSEDVDPEECMDETCKYFVHVKWASEAPSMFGFHIYHDIDLQIIARANG
jgi:hypothetical protein